MIHQFNRLSLLSFAVPDHQMHRHTPDGSSIFVETALDANNKQSVLPKKISDILAEMRIALSLISSTHVGVQDAPKEMERN